MGPIDCPETSVENYDSTLRDIPEERRSREFLNSQSLVQFDFIENARFC
jgi:hypothetical protein